MRVFPIPFLVSLALFAAHGLAQPDIARHPVQFARGQSAVTIKGSLTGDQSIDCTLRAAAGQTMTVKLSAGASVNFNLLPPGSTGEALFIGSRDGTRSTTQLPASGEYTIRVYQMGHAKSSGQRSSFALEVAITGGTPKAAASPSAADDDRLVETSARASQRKFNATGKIQESQTPPAMHETSPGPACGGPWCLVLGLTRSRRVDLARFGRSLTAREDRFRPRARA